jgi:hypothetical protein
LESFRQTLVLSVVLIYLLYSLLLDEVPDDSAVHQLHEEGFEVIAREAEVEVELRVL